MENNEENAINIMDYADIDLDELPKYIKIEKTSNNEDEMRDYFYDTKTNKVSAWLDDKLITFSDVKQYFKNKRVEVLDDGTEIESVSPHNFNRLTGFFRNLIPIARSHYKDNFAGDYFVPDEDVVKNTYTEPKMIISKFPFRKKKEIEIEDIGNEFDDKLNNDNSLNDMEFSVEENVDDYDVPEDYLNYRDLEQEEDEVVANNDVSDENVEEVKEDTITEDDTDYTALEQEEDEVAADGDDLEEVVPQEVIDEKEETNTKPKTAIIYSSDVPTEYNRSLIEKINELKKQGYSRDEIVDGLHLQGDVLDDFNKREALVSKGSDRYNYLKQKYNNSLEGFTNNLNDDIDNQRTKEYDDLIKSFINDVNEISGFRK